MKWVAGIKRWGSAGRTAAAEARWVVVDCETTGLDVRADKIIAIGAVAVRGERIVIDDSYSTLVRPERESPPANVLIHGIGHSAQASGRTSREALADFIEFAGQDPLVAFHAPFDRAMLEHAAREAGLGKWRRAWLDVAGLLPVLFPAHAKDRHSLDEWLDAFSISHPARHDAAADAYATAQLLQIGLVEARRQGFASVAELMKAGASSRWIS